MYGENSEALRTELAALLRQHRIQYRIGGPGVRSIPISTTTAEREAIGGLIRRYRYGVLTWCQQALTSAGPALPHDPASPAAPARELRRRLQVTMNNSSAGLPTMTDLTTPHPFALVDHWRRAARAAVFGEHDLAGELSHGRLDVAQRTTLVSDAAEVVRGLLVLDYRYENVPGWEPLRQSGRLRNAAEACSYLAADDYSIDRRGWHPRAVAIDAPVRPGLAGVIQAQHNMLRGLARFPNALNLRRLLASQRELSSSLATRVAPAHPELAEAWLRRAATYTALQRASREIGGHVGAGSGAAAEAANAISRLRRIPQQTTLNDRALRDLNSLFTAVDHKVADTIEHGARDRLYLAATPLPRIVDTDGQITHTARIRYNPIPKQNELVRLVRDELRPPPESRRTPTGARVSRRALSEAITHRPLPDSHGPEL